MTDQPELIRLDDGRDLEVVRLGDPSGTPVVFHHGTPGAWSTARLFAPAMNDAGVTLYAYSRAGYGRSTPLTGRSISSVVSDVVQLRRHFGVSNYVAMGWSGGGPHSLACAALDPECLGAISLAGVAPFSESFDWVAGMGPENVQEFEAARRGGEEFETGMEAASSELREITGPDVASSLGGLVDRPDVLALEDEAVADTLARSFQDAFALSARGMIDDDYAFVADWGFSLSSLTRPTHIWFGDADLMVPPTHGQWLARETPGGVAVHFPEDGHISLLTRHWSQLAQAVVSMSTQSSEMGR